MRQRPPPQERNNPPSLNFAALHPGPTPRELSPPRYVCVAFCFCGIILRHDRLATKNERRADYTKNWPLEVFCIELICVHDCSHPLSLRSICSAAFRLSTFNSISDHRSIAFRKCHCTPVYLYYPKTSRYWLAAILGGARDGPIPKFRPVYSLVVEERFSLKWRPSVGLTTLLEQILFLLI